MNKLDKLKELIRAIKNDSEIIRFKELEKVIDHNASLQKDFSILLDLQKDMVQKEYKKDKKYDKARDDYETQKHKVLQYLLVEEYLDLLENINNDLALIQSIIEQEININFD